MKKIQHFACTRFKTGLTGLLLLLTPALYAQNNILYVNQNVSSGNGSDDSWVNVLTSLSDALKYARLQHDADTSWLQNDSLLIFVAKGTYKPQYNAVDGQYTTNGNRDNAFVMVKTPAGVHRTEVSIISQNGENAAHYVLVVERPFAFRDIVVQKFDNTLLVNNNPETNEYPMMSTNRWITGMYGSRKV